MTGSLTCQYSDSCRLDTDATRQVLARAVKQQARVDLSANCDGDKVTCSGALVDGDDSRLALRLVKMDSAVGAILSSSAIQAGMEVGGTRYAFETRRVDAGGEVEPGLIHVLAPAAVTRTDRRRSPRRRLRAPTEVMLHASGGSDGWWARAAMLNLSPDGIACRIARHQAHPLSIGQTVRAVIRIGTSSPALDLSARVINMTQGGTASHLVLGLEFIADESRAANRIRLREMLEMAD